MQTKSIDQITQDEILINLLRQAVNGDQEAVNQLLSIFDPDIKHCARFIRSSREDAIQSIKTEFIELITTTNSYATIVHDRRHRISS